MKAEDRRFIEYVARSYYRQAWNLPPYPKKPGSLPHMGYLKIHLALKLALAASVDHDTALLYEHIPGPGGHGTSCQGCLRLWIDPLIPPKEE